MKRTFNENDVERLEADLDLAERGLAIVRAHCLDAMEHVEYRTGWRLMNRLYKAQEYVGRAKWALEELTPPTCLPASYMAPDMVDDWLRKGVQGPESHEGKETDD